MNRTLGCESTTASTRLARTGCSPAVPISSLHTTLPSTYSALAGISLMSEALTTLGCVTSVSHTEASSRATGVASPACPPISAPTPVGTSSTALNCAVFSDSLARNSAMPPPCGTLLRETAGEPSPASVVASQR